MTARYAWKPSSHIKIDAQEAGEELERIRTRHNGRLETDMVVSAARNEQSPLHDHFEWNDSKAAASWRSEQAGHLIRCITVEIEKPSGAMTPVRAFVSVKRDEDRSYTTIAHALSDNDLRVQVLARAWSELEAWRNRHAELIELAEIFSMIDQARSA